MSDECTATAELVKALANARARFSRVEKDGTNPHLHNRYATLGAVLEAVTGPLLESGVVVTQTPVPIESGRWALQTTLRHVGGGEVSGLVPLEYAEAKGLNPMQALGSAISYGRRYGLLSMLCLTAEDDDGATAGLPASRPAARGDGRHGTPPRGPRPVGPARDQDESPEALRDRQTVALARLAEKVPASSGKALFRLVLDLDPARNLLKAVNDFGAQQGWGPKLVEWSTPHVMEAVAFVREEMELVSAADRELN